MGSFLTHSFKVFTQGGLALFPWAFDKVGHHGGKDAAEQSCSPRGGQEAEKTQNKERTRCGLPRGTPDALLPPAKPHLLVPLTD